MKGFADTVTIDSHEFDPKQPLGHIKLSNGMLIKFSETEHERYDEPVPGVTVFDASDASPRNIENLRTLKSYTVTPDDTDDPVSSIREVYNMVLTEYAG
jgi:hypothetical protein